MMRFLYTFSENEKVTALLFLSAKNKWSRLNLPPPQTTKMSANNVKDIVKPPSILKFLPRFAVMVARNIVKAIMDADILEKKPRNKRHPPVNSAPFARKAITSGNG